MWAPKVLPAQILGTGNDTGGPAHRLLLQALGASSIMAASKPMPAITVKG